MVLHINGNLCIGGGFTIVGEVLANYVAKWDGSAWSALGAGVNNPFYALAVAGSNLYVGGDFTTAGGKVTAYLAKANLAGSPPAFTSIVPYPSGTQALLKFTAEPGASRHLLSSTNLASMSFLPTTKRLPDSTCEVLLAASRARGAAC